MISDHILTELANTLANPYFQQRLTPQQSAGTIVLLQSDAIITPITKAVHGVATHAEDDMVLATAVSGQADVLVTGDKQLQRVGKYQGVTILSPLAFLDVLTQQEVAA
jgi:putative PIN family toxin of toxin-antitoxin system